MSANWISSVPFFKDASAGAIQSGKNNVVKNEMDIGPAKRRRRSSSNVQIRSGKISQITLSQLLAFRSWFTGDIAEGALPFVAVDPFDGQTKLFVIDGGYKERKTGDLFEITATLEIHP